MSRVSLIEQLYAKKKSALEFQFDSLWAPPIHSLLSQQDIDQLYHIATSLRYNGNINKKYELIDAVMRPRGFRRGNCGTNRVVYNFLEDPTFVAKIALDKVGIKDSPAEFKNQRFLQPFCCKVFEVDRSGVIAFVEKVNPITSLEEFASIADDVFNMMITKIIGKYVVDDLGTSKFMNYGLRQNANGCTFGPVVIDFPYVYELDGGKLICNKPVKDMFGHDHPCGGEIDYDAGLNNLYCSKCGRKYTAQELSKDDSSVLIMYDEGNLKGELSRMRARIVTPDGTVIKDSGRSSKTYVSKEDYEGMNAITNLSSTEPREVEKSIKKRSKPVNQLKRDYFNELQAQLYESIKDKERFNPVIDTTIATDAVGRKDTRPVTYGEYVMENNGSYEDQFVSEAIDASAITSENPPEDIAKVDDTFDKEPETEEAVEESAPDVAMPDMNVKSVNDDDDVEDLGSVNTEDVKSDEIDNISHQFGQDIAAFIMQNINSGGNDEEPDYSNYIPEEDKEDESETDPNDNIEEEEDTHVPMKKRRSFDDDMSEY